MVEDNVVEVPFDGEHLLESILSPENLNKAYKAVIRNKGCGGIDRMSCEELLPWLLANKKSLICSLLDGSYRPNPVLRVEIPKDNGKMRQLGIPTVVDRLVQQAINQVLTSIYEPQFSRNSFGFRPGRGCHAALRSAKDIVNSGYKYVVDLDLRHGMPQSSDRNSEPYNKGWKSGQSYPQIPPKRNHESWYVRGEQRGYSPRRSLKSTFK